MEGERRRDSLTWCVCLRERERETESGHAERRQTARYIAPGPRRHTGGPR